MRLFKLMVMVMGLSGCIIRYSYGIFQENNHDDPVREGTYRITDDRGRVGYADEVIGVIIHPQYTYAFPFSGGKAKVTYSEKVQTLQNPANDKTIEWFYIDRQGNKL